MQSDDRHNKHKVADESSSPVYSDEWGVIFDAIPDQLALIDLDMRLIRVKEAFAKQLGKRPDDVVGEPCYRYVCGREMKEHCPHRLTIQDGKTYSAEFRLEHLGGDYLVTTSPLRDRNGTICGSVHVARDITDTKRASDALRQSETRFRGLVEQSLVGIYILREVPVSFLAQRQLPEWLIEWLDLIPAAIFGALIFPDLFLAGEPRHLELLQPKLLVALPTFLFALKTRSLGGTVLIGMFLYWLAERSFDSATYASKPFQNGLMRLHPGASRDPDASEKRRFRRPPQTPIRGSPE